MPHGLPSGRCLVHRPTGQIVGPIAPIYEEDWPLREIADSETLWRYMNLDKFADLLTTSTLYFARGDKFKDPFEGRLSPGNSLGSSKSEQAFRGRYAINSPNAEAVKYHEIHRKVVFISCWHRSTRETTEMWMAYAPSPKSVVITTSGRALRCFLPRELMKYAVKYAPLDFPRTEFSHNSLFFYKPESYAFEQEFRMLRSPGEDESFDFDNPDDQFRRVPIRLNKVIHRVITHPGATVTTKHKVDDLIRRYLPSLRRLDSALQV